MRACRTVDPARFHSSVVDFCNRTSGAQILLSGLSAYFCVDHSKGHDRPGIDELRTKKARREHERRLLEIQGAQAQVYKQVVGPQGVRMLPFTDDIDTLVRLAKACAGDGLLRQLAVCCLQFIMMASCVINAAAVLACAALAGLPQGSFANNVLMLAVVYLILVLLKACLGLYLWQDP